MADKVKLDEHGMPICGRPAMTPDGWHTILLFQRAPARVRDGEWPVKYRSKCENPACSAWMEIRQHNDGRWLCYGGADLPAQMGGPIIGGFYSGEGMSLSSALERLAVGCLLHPQLAIDIVQQLPPEVL